MTKSKQEIIDKLTILCKGVQDPEWVKWPVHRLLSYIDEVKLKNEYEVVSDDFSSRITGTFKQDS